MRYRLDLYEKGSCNPRRMYFHTRKGAELTAISAIITSTYTRGEIHDRWKDAVDDSVIRLSDSPDLLDAVFCAIVILIIVVLLNIG